MTANGANNLGDELFLHFTTTPTPNSLLGFAGGSITTSDVAHSNSELVYISLSGSITPVPEPSSLALLGAGLLPVIGVIRRRYLNR